MASPGRSHRKGVTLLQLAERFPDEESAQRWFEKVHWPDGNLSCLRCGSENVCRCKHKAMPFRCRDCKKYYSAKTGTAMESSNLPLRKWLRAIYLEYAIRNYHGLAVDYYRKIGIVEYVHSKLGLRTVR